VTVEGWGPGSSEVDGPDGFPLVDGAFPVWEENWPSIQAFLKVRTQWRRDGGVPVGLDYTAVDVALRRARMDDADRMFEDIQLMETVIIAEWGKQRQADEAIAKLRRGR
jgi:hypothetical protein